MPTKAAIIAIFRNTYPACSDADCSRHFDEAHEKILIDMSLHQGTWSTTLTAGLRKYPFQTALKNVIQVTYITESSTPDPQTPDTSVKGKNLVPTSPELLLAQNDDLTHDLSTGVPERYWFQSDWDPTNLDATILNIYLDPIPDTTSTAPPGLLPRIVAFGTYVVDLVDGDSIPPEITDSYIYVARMKRGYSREFKGSQDPDTMAADAEYSQLLNEAKAAIYQRQRLNPPVLQPRFFQSQRRVV